MEDNISLPELDLLISTLRKQKKEEYVFLASMQGIDLEKYWGNPIEERRREVEKRAAERLYGREEVERAEFAEFGLDFG